MSPALDLNGLDTLPQKLEWKLQLEPFRLPLLLHGYPFTLKELGPKVNPG